MTCRDIDIDRCPIPAGWSKSNCGHTKIWDMDKAWLTSPHEHDSRSSVPRLDRWIMIIMLNGEWYPHWKKHGALVPNPNDFRWTNVIYPPNPNKLLRFCFHSTILVGYIWNLLPCGCSSTTKASNNYQFDTHKSHHNKPNAPLPSGNSTWLWNITMFDT